MTLDQLFGLLKEASALSHLNEFVVIGSLSVLGVVDLEQVPEDMTLSNDLDCYTKDDPGRVFSLVPSLGENSAFHEKNGIYLDAVSPHLPTLPEGWPSRLIPVQRNGLTAWFLEPHDAAISKYTRSDPRDRRWLRAGIRANVFSLPLVKARARTTTFLDAEERLRVEALLEEDARWVSGVAKGGV